MMPTVKTVKSRTIDPTRSAVSPRCTLSLAVETVELSPKISFIDFLFASIQAAII